jgi:periplasmic copper chaperone A
MNRLLASFALSTLACLTPGLAQAHVSIISGPAVADETQEVTFGVGHGCAGADTYRIEIQIPAGVTSVRPLTSDFGPLELMSDDAGTVVMIAWQKPEDELLPADTQYYKLTLRMKAPDEPFTTLLFPARQTCRAEDGTETVVDWVGQGAGGSEEAEPAPVLLVVPPSFPGWNRFRMPAPVDDLAAFFQNALIVWRGSAAYSVNPMTTELIATTEGVTPLNALAAGDQIWVKY